MNQINPTDPITEGALRMEWVTAEPDAVAAEPAADTTPQASKPTLSSAQLAWGAMLMEAFRPDAAPQAQQGSDPANTEPAGWMAKVRAAIARGWEWTAARGKALSAWWSGSTWLPRHWSGVALMLIAAVMCGAIGYVVTLRLIKVDWAGVDAEQPAAVQTNPLAPLVARIESLDAQMAELQDQVADLQEDRQPMATPRRRTTTRSASPPSDPPTPRPTDAWSAPTDLDRAIDTFNTTLQESAK